MTTKQFLEFEALVSEYMEQHCLVSTTRVATLLESALQKEADPDESAAIRERLSGIGDLFGVQPDLVWSWVQVYRNRYVVGRKA